MDCARCKDRGWTGTGYLGDVDSRFCDCEKGKSFRDIFQGRITSSSLFPEVGGRKLPIPLSQFETSCRVKIGEIVAKMDCDTHLVRILCDAVRLAREYADSKNTIEGIW